MPPSISIVINNYNYGRFLGEAIRSALEQSIAALEVIVVDDGSTDNSHDVIESFGNRIVGIFQDNGGQAAAFNTGIRSAKGDWVWLLDADDSLKVDALEKAMPLIGPGVSRIAMGLDLIDANGDLLGTQLPNKGQPFTGSLRDAILKLEELPSTPTSGNIFLRKGLLEVLPVPEDKFCICADAYLFVMSGISGKVKVSPIAVANYRIHGANHYFSQNSDPFDIPTVRKQLNNALLVMDVLEKYGLTLSKKDSNRIRRFWNADQLLPEIIRAKLARIPHETLSRWSWLRLMTYYLICVLLSQQSPANKLRGLRKSLKLLLKQAKNHPRL